MKIIRPAALILALSLIPASFLSCSQKKDPSDEQNQTGTSVPPPVSSEAETEPELPYAKADFKGYNFKMIVRGPSYGYWESNEMWSDETNGEALNDAVYQRISDVQEMYKVKISVIKPQGSIADEAARAIQSGGDEYDAVLTNPGDSASLALNGMLYDLHSVKSVKLDSPWWDHAANTGLSVANKLYYTTGEISYDRYRATEAILFNKHMLKQYELEDPYELVRKGKWTFSKLTEMCQGVSQDLDGNGKFDEKDRYGMVTYPNVVTSGIFASGIHYNTKDDKDIPILSFFSERTSSVIQKYIDFTLDSAVCFDWSKYYKLASDPNTKVGLVIFQENRALFNYNGIHAVPNLRNMFADFGILPLPKFDEAQENYFHCANNTACPFVMIPSSVKDPERSGTIIDALAHKGRDLVKVAFYDITLKSKASRDSESAEMLDLIFDHMVYDIAFFNNFGNIGNLASDMLAAKNTNLASEYAKIESNVKASMDKFISDINK